MNWTRAIVLKAIVLGAIAAAGSMTAPRVSAQTTFQSYRCGDGAKFIVAFYPGDSRAHMQIDGREVTLAKRLAISVRAIRAAASACRSPGPARP